jgi:hypothetical protein
MRERMKTKAKVERRTIRNREAAKGSKNEENKESCFFSELLSYLYFSENHQSLHSTNCLPISWF